MTLHTDDILVVGFKKIIKDRNRARVATSNIATTQLGIPDLADIVTDYIFGVKKIVPAELADSIMTAESRSFTYSIPFWDKKIYLDFDSIDDTENTIITLHTWHPQRLKFIINWGEILDILTTGYSEPMYGCLSRIMERIGFKIDPVDFMNSYYDFLVTNLDCI